MWLRRLAWAAALTAALLFQITNENYLGRFLLALCIALPLLSLALSLPGMLRCRLSLSAVPAATARGGGAEWAVDTSVPPPPPPAPGPPRPPPGAGVGPRGGGGGYGGLLE